jgi:hypothetical protein
VIVPVENRLDFDHVAGWSPNFYQLDFSPGRSVAANNLLWTGLSPQSFLSEPATLVDAEMAQIARPEVGGEASFVVKRDGVVHGLGGWFEAELTPGMTISNTPPNDVPSWSQAFLPLERPLRVKTGDILRVRVQTGHNAAQWQWQVNIQSDTNGKLPALEEVGCGQTTLTGQLLAPAHTLNPDRKPVRTADGEVDLFILQRMDGSTSIREIARQTFAKFPAQCSSLKETLAYVFGLSEEYGRWTDNLKLNSLNGKSEKDQAATVRKKA